MALDLKEDSPAPTSGLGALRLAQGSTWTWWGRGADNADKANKTAWICGHKALFLPRVVSITEKEEGTEAGTFLRTFRNPQAFCLPWEARVF